MRRRRLALVALAAVVFLAAAWTAWWFVMAGRAADWIAAWSAPAEGKDWHGRFEAAEVTGYPFSMDVRLERPVVVWQGGAAGATWEGPWLVAAFRPWSLARFDLTLPPEQTVTTDDGRSLRMIALALEDGRGRVEIEGGRAATVAVTLAGVVATWAQNRPPVTFGRIAATAEPVSDEPGWSLALRVEEARFPAEAPEPFTGEVPLLATSLHIRGDVPSAPLDQALAAWRDGGGVVDVDSLLLDWPPLTVEGDGTVTLDREMRPLGAFTAKLTGWDELIDAFAAMGRLTDGQASIASTLLGAMATTGEDGRRRLVVPVSMQDGLLYAGPVQLGELPPLLP